MQPKTIGNYGGAYADAQQADNPETDIAAAEFNQMAEDTAQATQTVGRAWVTFTTSNAAAAVLAPALVSHNSVWGSGAGQKPTVEKTNTGRYTITYAASFPDGLSVSESVAFLHPLCGAWQASNIADDLYAEVVTLASNVITIKTESPKGTLADVGDIGAAVFKVTLELR